MPKYHFEIRVTETLVGARYFEVEGADRASARRLLWEAYRTQQDGDFNTHVPPAVRFTVAPGAGSSTEIADLSIIPEPSSPTEYETDLYDYSDDGRPLEGYAEEVADLMAED